jgi:hypothetical protein
MAESGALLLKPRRLLQVGAGELDAGKVADWNPGILGDEYLIAIPALSHHDLDRASGRFGRTAGVEAGTNARTTRIPGNRSGAGAGGRVIAGYFDRRVCVQANDVRCGVGWGGWQRGKDLVVVFAADARRIGDRFNLLEANWVGRHSARSTFTGGEA